jgi:signal transduction histidine kinase
MEQHRSRLQTKFFVALLIVGILPGVAALIATYLYSTESLKHSIGNGFQEIARSTSIRIAGALDMEIDRAERLALVPVHIRRAVEQANRRFAGKTDKDIQALLTAEQTAWLAARSKGIAPPLPDTTAYLNEWVREIDYYVRVVIADAHGALVAASDAQTPYLHGEQEWWQEAFEESVPYVSSIRFDLPLNDYVFEVAVPIFDERHSKTIGTVGLVVRRAVLMKTILPIRIGNTGHGMLLDTEGTPLICPVLPPTAHLIHQALLNQLAHDQPLWLVAENDAHGGHNAIVGAAPVQLAHKLSTSSLGGERWFAFVRQQPEETYAPIYSLLVTVGMIGFGLVIVLASLGFVVGRQIVSPILTLRREADALRRNLAAPPDALSPQADDPPLKAVEIKTGDEIEDLARTFEALRIALADSLRTVRVQQEELIRREKLASVGQLLAALAHDLRNPLGVIRSSAQLVLEEQQTDQVKQEVARYIIEEVDRLTHRINDFLRYARQKPPEPKVVSPKALVEAALWQWKAQGGNERIEVRTQFMAPLGNLQLDPDQVKEAMVNLLINAREAMPNGGRLTVTTRSSQAGQIEIEIADTGCGISQEHLERIFEPFFTTKDYGTGLGLTNVKRLIQDNGGILAVQSTEGSGTRFVIGFPAVPSGNGQGGAHERRPAVAGSREGAV